MQKEALFESRALCRCAGPLRFPKEPEALHRTTHHFVVGREDQAVFVIHAELTRHRRFLAAVEEVMPRSRGRRNSLKKAASGIPGSRVVRLRGGEWMLKAEHGLVFEHVTG